MKTVCSHRNASRKGRNAYVNSSDFPLSRLPHRSLRHLAKEMTTGYWGTGDLPLTCFLSLADNKFFCRKQVIGFARRNRLVFDFPSRYARSTAYSTHPSFTFILHLLLPSYVLRADAHENSPMCRTIMYRLWGQILDKNAFKQYL